MRSQQAAPNIATTSATTLVIPPFLAYDQAMRYLAVITLTLLVLTGCQTFGPRLADHAAELKRIRPLAEQGDAKAQTRLGVMYR